MYNDYVDNEQDNSRLERSESLFGNDKVEMGFLLADKNGKSTGIKGDEQDNATAGGRIQNGERKYQFGE